MTVIAASPPLRPSVEQLKLRPAAEVSDRKLIRAAQDGSDEAIEQIFRRHWPAAHRAAFLVVRDAMAAEDIAQEAFLSAFRAIGRFDWRRPFAPWLHRIVVNRAIDWSRARALRGEVAGGESAVDLPALRPGEPSDVDMQVDLGLLTAEHRAVIVLRYLLDYRPGEIAEMLDLPRGTVNSRLRRGLDQLRGQIEERHEER